jgi:uncharacterized membrane protein YeiH
VLPADIFGSIVVALEWAAVAVFAVTGALVASRKQMDIFGFILLGTVTGIGGGTVRDLVLGHAPVFWVREPAYLVVCAVVSSIVFFTAHIPQSRYRVLLWLDAVGLALVAVIGAERGLHAGPVVAITMGVVTAAFGGIIRDVLGGESPLILRREIYVTAAMAAAAVFVALASLAAPRWLDIGAGFTVGFVIRALAIRYEWSLPAYKGRPGRRADDAGGSGSRV